MLLPNANRLVPCVRISDLTLSSIAMKIRLYLNWKKMKRIPLFDNLFHRWGISGKQKWISKESFQLVLEVFHKREYYFFLYIFLVIY